MISVGRDFQREAALVRLELPERRRADHFSREAVAPRNFPRDFRLLNRLLVREPLESALLEHPEIDDVNHRRKKDRPADPGRPAALLEFVHRFLHGHVRHCPRFDEPKRKNHQQDEKDQDADLHLLREREDRVKKKRQHVRWHHREGKGEGEAADFFNSLSLR